MNLPFFFCPKGALLLRLAGAGIIAFILISAVSPTFVFGSQAFDTGVIIAAKLHMRSAPDAGTPSLKILLKGTTVRILSRESGWLQIVHNGQVGYIRNRSRYVRIVKTKEQKDTDRTDSILQIDKQTGRLKEESLEIDRKITEHRKEVLTFTKQEADLVESLNDIALSINNARKVVAGFKNDIEVIESKIDETSKASGDLINKINISQAYATKRMVALYKLNWLGRLNVIASADSIYDLFQRKFALGRILVYDETVRQQLIDNRIRLENLLQQLSDQKTEKLALEKKYNTQISLMSKKQDARSKLLAEIRNKKSLELAAIEVLRRSARALDQRIGFLNTATYQERDEKVPAKNFSQLKGLLKMPVKGTIITSFGSYRNTRFKVLNFRSGIDIKADRGEPIRAVSIGRVIYANWFKGYGNMLILDHGNSYYTVYAHVEEFFKAKGDMVDAGEVIATAGDTGSMMAPGLYFEVRHRGKPLDPLQWINRG